MARAVFFFIVLLVSTVARTEDKRVCDNTYFVSIGDFWPVGSRTMGTEAKGFGYDLANEIGSRSGCKVVIALTPPSRNWRDLEEGKADIIMVNIKNSSASAKYGNFVPLLKSRRILVLNRSIYHKDWTIQNYIDAPKVRFSGIINSRFAYQEGEIETLRKQHLYVETTDTDNLLSLISRGKADATFFTQGAFAHYKKRLENATDLIIVPDEQTWLIGGLYVSKKRINKFHQNLIASAVKDIHDDGTMEKIFAKYLGHERAKEMLDIPH